MNNLISIVIPVYNVELYIERCIKSVLDQTYLNFELILVDDGSKDKSGILCDLFAKQDNRIRVFHNKNKGAGAARKFGVQHSKGEWIMFVDSDDTIPTTALQDLLNLNINNTYDIIVGTVLINNKLLPHHVFGSLSSKEYIRAILTNKTIVGPVAKLYKRTLFENIDWETPKYVIQNEDLFMLVLLGLNCKNIYISPTTIVYNYYWKNGGASSQKMSLEGWMYIINHLFNRFQDEIEIEKKDSLIDSLNHYKIRVLYKYCILKGIYIKDKFLINKTTLSFQEKRMLFVLRHYNIQKIIYFYNKTLLIIKKQVKNIILHNK